MPTPPLPTSPAARFTAPTFDEVEEALIGLAIRHYIARCAHEDTAALMRSIDNLLELRQTITDCWHAHAARTCA